MSVRSHLPGYRWFHFLRNAAVRTGVYIGVCLTLVFSAWLVIANRVPLLDRLAWERDLAAAAVLCFLAAVPVLRFFRDPGNLLASSLIGWLFFSFCYRVLCFVFHALGDKLSTFHLFVLGAFVYMILTTLSWIGTFISRARAAHISHPNHHVS
jgi:cytochrome bd-type quinol oxidase subunit 2